jgi:hypothetical protein
MRINASRCALFWGLVVCSIISFSPLQSSDDGAADVRVVSVKVERVGHNKASLSLKVVNRSNRPVFLAGVNIEGPLPYPVFLEQWQADGGWTAVAPCMDVPPPQVIRLDPGKELATGYNLRVPPPRSCGMPNLQLEGRFRYRLDYFLSKKKAQKYLLSVYSPGRQPARAHVALSEPFEIPAPNE